MINSARYISRQKADIKVSREEKLRKKSEKEKEKGISEDKDKVGVDIPNPDSDMRIDNGKENSAQEQEKKNLDLVMKNNDQASSLTSLLSIYEETESLDSANSWD